MKSFCASLVTALVGIVSIASASVFLPHQHHAGSALQAIGLQSLHASTGALTRRQRADLRLALRKQRAPTSSAAMVIPGYGVMEQVFVGGFTNFLSIYNLIITARILLSWFPQAQGIGALQPVYAITDPYLNLFRGIIPPLFGLDFSPILAFFLLNLLSNATAAVGCEIPPEFSQKKRYQLPSSALTSRASVLQTWSRQASRPGTSNQLTLNY